MYINKVSENGKYTKSNIKPEKIYVACIRINLFPKKYMRFIMLTDQRNAKMTKQFQKKKIFEIHGMSEIFTHVKYA